MTLSRKCEAVNTCLTQPFHYQVRTVEPWHRAYSPQTPKGPRDPYRGPARSKKENIILTLRSNLLFSLCMLYYHVLTVKKKKALPLLCKNVLNAVKGINFIKSQLWTNIFLIFYVMK